MTRKGGHRFFLAQTRNAFVAEIMLNQRLRARGRSEEAPSRLLQFQQKRKPILTSGTVEKQELRADRRSEEKPSRPSAAERRPPTRDVGLCPGQDRRAAAGHALRHQGGVSTSNTVCGSILPSSLASTSYLTNVKV